MTRDDHKNMKTLEQKSTLKCGKQNLIKIQLPDFSRLTRFNKRLNFELIFGKM